MELSNDHVTNTDNKSTFFLMKPIQAYLKHYRDVPSSSWGRILLTLINDMATGVVFFLSLYFVNVLHMNISTAGFIISSYGIGTAVGGILGGKLTDKFTPNLITGSCLLIEAIVFLGFIMIYAIPFLIIMEFILGVATYTFSTANKICVLNNLKGHENIKLKVLSLFYASSNLGLGLSAMMISRLAHYEFFYVFLLSSSALLVSVILTTLPLHKKVAKCNEPSNLDNEEIKSGNTQSSNNKFVFWLVLSCLFCIGLIIAQLSSTYPIYLSTSPNLDMNAVSIAFTLNSFMILLLQTPIVNYFNNYNKIIMVGIGAFLMGCGMCLLNAAFTYSIVIISMIVYTAGEMIFFSMAQIVVYQHSDNKKKGQSLGLFQSTFALSVIIGPTLGGYIYHHMGASTLWYSSGIIGLLCLLMTYSYKKYDISEQS